VDVLLVLLLGLDVFVTDTLEEPVGLKNRDVQSFEHWLMSAMSFRLWHSLMQVLVEFTISAVGLGTCKHLAKHARSWKLHLAEQASFGVVADDCRWAKENESSDKAKR
jgi:hypothetical protein